MPELEEQKLPGREILIADDDSTVASCLKQALGAEGAKIVCPWDSIEDLLDMVMSSRPIDGAVLSLSLHGEETFVAAENLARRHIPFVFLKGSNAPEVPDHFEGATVLEKSCDAADIVQHMKTIIVTIAGLAALADNDVQTCLLAAAMGLAGCSAVMTPGYRAAD
ncbi:hypothetical protein ACWGS9_24715 [Bradyrhizobium sp. Arg314]